MATVQAVLRHRGTHLPDAQSFPLGLDLLGGRLIVLGNSDRDTAVDIVAHGLWAFAGGEVLRRRGLVSDRQLAAGVTLAVALDLIQMIPVVLGVFAGLVSIAELGAYATANPGQEPILQPWVSALAHHLHCSMHSAVLTSVASLVAWWLRPAWLYPLLGWWLHIATDVPTHSADYYAVPVFYPFTYRGFDGFAWTSPWFMALNYAALVAIGLWLYRTRGAPLR